MSRVVFPNEAIKKELTASEKEVAKFVDSLPEHLSDFLKSKYANKEDILKLSLHDIKSKLKILSPVQKKRKEAKKEVVAVPKKKANVMSGLNRR